MAQSNDPRLFLALRPQDPVPDWITHILFLGEDLQITLKGSKEDVGQALFDDMEKMQNAPVGGFDKIPRYHAEFGRSLTEYGVAQDPAKFGETQQVEY